jgi:hypothetical protein
MSTFFFQVLVNEDFSRPFLGFIELWHCFADFFANSSPKTLRPISERINTDQFYQNGAAGNEVKRTATEQERV